MNLFDYLDTGLFLDHRPLRLHIAEQAQDVRFLNLFGYTGAATVQAAVGGARLTTTVDLSGTYLEWCADNLRENDIGGTRHRLVQADALTWLEADTQYYDMIFCDPPTFSNSKRAPRTSTCSAKHVRLLRAAVARLAENGVLYFSNNFRRFRLDEAADRGVRARRGHQRAHDSAGLRARRAHPSLLAAATPLRRPRHSAKRPADATRTMPIARLASALALSRRLHPGSTPAG